MSVVKRSLDDVMEARLASYDRFRREHRWSARVNEIKSIVVEYGFTTELFKMVIGYSRLIHEEVKALTDQILSNLKDEFQLHKLAYNADQLLTLTDETLYEFEVVDRMWRLYFADQKDNGKSRQLELMTELPQIHIGPRCKWHRAEGLSRFTLCGMPMGNFASVMSELAEKKRRMEVGADATTEICEMFGFQDVAGSIRNESILMFQRWIEETSHDKNYTEGDYYDVCAYGLKVLPKASTAHAPTVRPRFDGVFWVEISPDTDLTTMVEFLGKNHTRINEESQQMTILHDKLDSLCLNLTRAFQRVKIHRSQYYRTPHIQRYIFAFEALLHHKDDLNEHLLWNEPTVATAITVLVVPPTETGNPLYTPFTYKNSCLSIPADFDSESFNLSQFVKRISAVYPFLLRPNG